MEIFDYDNILLLPRKCRVDSRSECDPSVEFGLRFETQVSDEDDDEEEDDIEVEDDTPRQDAEVVSLDKFRKH